MEPEESKKLESGVVVAEAGDVAQTTANDLLTDEEFTLYVGDVLEFTAGPLVGLRGMIYYLDEEHLRIMPTGVSDMLREIDTSIFEDPTTEVSRDPTSLDKFVDILDLKEGNAVQTFTIDGTPVGVYKVTSLNEDEDSVRLKLIDTNGEEIGDELDLNFTVEGRVVGIPLEVDFAVMRPQELPKAPSAEEEDTEPVEEEADLEDYLDETEEKKEEEGFYISEMSPKDITYDDITQKNDFIENERAILKPAQRDNPRYLQRIRRLMENCLQLRNDISEYKETGRADPKPVAYQTLAQLLEKTDFPLSKQVLRVFRTLYLDHSEQYFNSRKPGEEEFFDPIELEDPSVALDIEYLEDAVNGSIDFLKNQLSIDITGRSPDLPPRLFEVLQSFYNTYFRVIGAVATNSREVKQTDFDRDFFRMNPLNEGDPILKGLNRVGDSATVVGTDSISPISLSYMRTIRSRIGRYGDRKIKMKGIIEQGDEAEVMLFVLFPFLFLRDLGAIRSGKLSIDVGNGLSNPKTMQMIIEEGGGIQTTPTANSIFAVDPEGKTVGNLELEEWLKGQTLYGNGIGDLLPYMKSIGLSDSEFTPTQFEILQKKIQFYQANLVKFLKENREKINKLIENPDPIKNFSFLSETEQKLFLDQLVGEEAILVDKVEEFKLKYPAWKDNDIAIFSYLYTLYPDYVLATLSGIPSNVALERNRTVNDLFLQRLHEDIEYQIKQSQRGNKPVINECDHVENLKKIREAPNDDDRIKLMIRKLLPTFEGRTEDHWIFCRICKDHLICEHEYLMILERVHPNQKDAIHKKILLTFSGGVFNGKFICRNCGQAIQDLEFDQNMEFDDEGRPMIGNQPISQEMETSLSKELDKLLEVTGEDVTTDPKKLKTVDKDAVFELLVEISYKVGVQLPIASLDRMLSTVKRMVANLPFKTADAWNKFVAKQQNPKAFPSFDQLNNQDLIAICGAAVLIEIQSAVPGYTIRSVVSDCKNPTFDGFPLNPDPTQVDALRYMSCALARLVRNEKPWSETAWVYMAPTQKDGYKRREDAILSLVNDFVTKMISEAEVQTLLEKKREYVIKERGESAVTGKYVEEIPSDFLPLPIVVTKEQVQNAEAPTIGEAATPSQKAYAWILEGHKIALKHGVYEKGNPLSEATCCYSPTKTPMEFWSDVGMPKLNPKLPPLGPRGNLLTLRMKVRDPELLLGSPNPTLMYRLFLRVCFPREGIVNPRVGLPHEPGYNNKCPFCQFEFPVDPRLPPPQLAYSKDKKVQQLYDEEYKTEVQELYQAELGGLQKQGVILGNTVEKEEFESLLQETNRRFLIPIAPVKTVAINMETLDGLIALEPEPFEGFRSILETLKTNLAELPPGSEEADIRVAYGPISAKMKFYKDSLKEFIEQKLPKDTFETRDFVKEINFLLESPAQTVGETLRTFVLLPIERATKQAFAVTSISDKNRKSIYKKIGTADREKVREFFKLHLDVVSSIQKTFAKEKKRKDLVDSKVEAFMNKLTQIIPLFVKVLRTNVIPFGSIGMPYIKNSILCGMFWEFVNPEDLGGSNALGLVLRDCLAKARDPNENTILSPDEIKRLIVAENESEKTLIIQQLDGMKPAEKRAELAMKALGLGRWSRGASKGIYSYDEEQQLFEDAEKAARGVKLFYNREDMEEQDSGYTVAVADGDEE